MKRKIIYKGGEVLLRKKSKTGRSVQKGGEVLLRKKSKTGRSVQKGGQDNYEKYMRFV